MNRNLFKTFALMGVASSMVLASGCAQDVGDINRVQPNYLSKADFEGVWYTRQTIIDVPGRVAGPFVGVSTSMEKVRWEVQQNYLIAYRAYEYIPGYDQDAGEKVDGETQYKDGVESQGRSDDYKEAPIAAFPIISHFDIQRSYNPATGEQTNVLVENTFDRPWDEREYMRVDWSYNAIAPTFVGLIEQLSDVSYYVDETEDSVEALYMERFGGDEEQLTYFDFTKRNAWGDAGDIKIRYSFERQPEYERDYEPIYYTDEMMTKFGYFRTERLVYDRGRGFLDDNYIRLGNRHDLWANDFKKNADGTFVRDAEGRRIPTPMADRTPKPIVYHLNPGFPVEMEPGAYAMAEDWNRAYQRTVAAAKGMTVEEIDSEFGDMFVLCHNPVQADDHADCDPRPLDRRQNAEGDFEPFSARPGDLRRSFVFWVHQPQASGPLGYGPSYADPETGEIISGTAYVYGAGVDRAAQSAVDYIKFAKGDFEETEIRDGFDVQQYLANGRLDETDPRAAAGKDLPTGMSDVSLADGMDMLLSPKQRNIFDIVEREGFEAMQASPGLVDRKIAKMKESGLDELLVDDEMIRAMSNGQLDPASATGKDIAQLLEDNNPLDNFALQKKNQERLEFASRHNIFLEEFFDDAILGLAKKYKDEKDYDAIWLDMRNEIFRAVMAHEVGHTIGLRHNFQGSYDSVNFDDQYWELRKENFEAPESVGDLYEANKLTAAQIDGDMTSHQYSSIMDYHSRINSDFSGIGKYDEAAVIFAYSTGTYADVSEDNVDPIPVEKGYVEVFEDVDTDANFLIPGETFNTNVYDFMAAFDDRFAPSQHPLETLHYTTLISNLGGPDAIRERKLVRFSELERQREEYAEKRASIEAQIEEDGVLDEVSRLIDQVNASTTQAQYDQRYAELINYYNEEYLGRLVSGDEPSLEVPYMFCSDEWAGATVSCDRWDLGADPLELVQWAVSRYNDYYPFSHFRRGRMTFSSFSGVSFASRSLQVMPFIYQQWFFDRYYSGDQTLSNYYTLAAYAGLNFLKDVIAMPNYGAYQYNAAENTYDLISFNPDSDSSSAQLRIYPGQGRSQFSRFDNGSGYYYFTRVTEAGHYWDFREALFAVTASAATALGVDTAADFRTYSLPYYLLFEDQLTDLFNGVFRRDYASVSPRVSDAGEMLKTPLAPLYINTNQGSTPFDPLTGNTTPTADEMANTRAINLRINFSQRFYAMLFGVALFNSNYSQHYVDQARIFKIGHGEQLSAPLGSGYEVVRFTDPTTGVSYGALQSTAPEATVGMGAKMINEGAGYAQIIASTAPDSNDYQNAVYELTQLVEDINMLSGTIDILGSPVN